MSLILNRPELFAEWQADVRTMAGRILAMRRELFRLLTEELRTPGNWDHLLNQIGMFRCVGALVRGVFLRADLPGEHPADGRVGSFTGITPEQSQALTEQAHIYLTPNGRISMAGLNEGNLRYFAENLDKAVRGQL